MKEKLNKYIPYISIGVIVLSLVLLAIPTQFFSSITGDKLDPSHNFSGYETIFYVGKNIDNATRSLGRASAGGIIGLIVLIIAIPFFILSKKSSSSMLLASVLTLLGGTLFMMMPLWILIIYKSAAVYLKWITYFVGAILLVVGALDMYFSVKRLMDEKSAPAKKSYSYIKNKK